MSCTGELVTVAFGAGEVASNADGAQVPLVTNDETGERATETVGQNGSPFATTCQK